MIFLFVVLVIYLMRKASLHKAALKILSCVNKASLFWYFYLFLYNILCARLPCISSAGCGSNINRASLLHNLKSNALVQTQQGFLANSMLINDIFICCPCNISYVQGFLA